MDFTVGDLVWDFRFGNGKVEQISDHAKTYPVAVVFEEYSDITVYTSDGKCFSADPNRCLFHGHNLKVIGEAVMRDRWIAIFPDTSCSNLFKTEQECKDSLFGGYKETTQIIKVRVKV